MMILNLVILSSCSNEQSVIVHFITNNDTQIESITIVSNEELFLPDNLLFEGHQFSGWYFDEELNLPVTIENIDFNAIEITLYAKWTINQYTLTFETNGGNQLDSMTINYQEALELSSPSRDSYEFIGWYLDEDCSIPLDLTHMPNENLLIYAKWIYNPETIRIGFIPSYSAGEELLNQIGLLELYLEAQLLELGHQIQIEFSVMASILQMTEAMASGTIDICYIDSLNYAQLSTNHPEDFIPLVSTSRNAHSAELNESLELIDDAAQIIYNANTMGKEAVQNYIVQTTGYYAAILVRKDDQTYYEIEGIEGLIGKTIAVQSITSNSGFVYPTFLLAEHGISYVYQNPNSALNQVEYTTVNGYNNAVLALANDEVDAAFVFLDARNSSAFEEWETINGKSIYDELVIMFLTDMVKNNLLVVNTRIGGTLFDDLQQIFLGDGIIDYSFQLFSYQRFIAATDADYDVTREVYEFIQVELN